MLSVKNIFFWFYGIIVIYLYIEDKVICDNFYCIVEFFFFKIEDIVFLLEVDSKYYLLN